MVTQIIFTNLILWLGFQAWLAHLALKDYNKYQLWYPKMTTLDRLWSTFTVWTGLGYLLYLVWG